MITFVCLGYSQEVTKGSLDVLKGKDRVNIELDFSQASIHGMDDDSFADYEHDWMKDKDEVVTLFVGEVMANCNRIIVGMFKNTEFTIKVTVLSINPKGDFYCLADVVDKSGQIVASISNIKEYGGKFGSKLNLIKDGARHTGARLGRFLNKKLK
jgi:hypothetical protein